MFKLHEVGRVRGVRVYVHWTVFAIAGVMLLGAVQRPALSLVGIACYLGVLLIHECGHAIAAQRRGTYVTAIELYPLHGWCRFEMPWSRYDHAIIAWGGVLAQAVVAIPLITYVLVFGYTRFEPLNAVIAILGFFSLGTMIFNLVPAGRLDGTMAWKFFPELWRRRRQGKARAARRSR